MSRSWSDRIRQGGLDAAGPLAYEPPPFIWLQKSHLAQSDLAIAKDLASLLRRILRSR